MNVEILPLSSSSRLAKEEHDEVLLNLEIQKRGNKLHSEIPTLAEDVRRALRTLNEPVHLFGENAANIRDRLRMCVARKLVLNERKGISTLRRDDKLKDDDEEVTKYTHAPAELISARKNVLKYSFLRARNRLELERKRRYSEEGENDTMKQSSSPSNVSLRGSQYAGDGRILSSVKYIKKNDVVVTAGWSSVIELFKFSSDQQDVLLGANSVSMAHEDRIMSMDVSTPDNQSNNSLLATASIDTTAKIFSISSEDKIFSLATLTGHKARLSRIAFHPSSSYIATTSFDHTWRLWDVETSKELLLQDGHCRETFGLAFHGDGSIVSVTDFAPTVQCWDLRSGKTIMHFFGHAKRVLNATFSNNGYHLFTSGDDGTIKVWDIRKRTVLSTILAHSKLISGMVLDASGDKIVSCSFDASIKIWSGKDFRLIQELHGHDGKVMSLDLLQNKNHSQPQQFLSVGYDKTLKLWY